MKAILVCPGYLRMALGALLSPPCASLAPALFTFSSFLSFFPHMKVPSADLCSAAFILSSSPKYKSFKEHFMRERVHKWDS